MLLSLSELRLRYSVVTLARCGATICGALALALSLGAWAQDPVSPAPAQTPAQTPTQAPQTPQQAQPAPAQTPAPADATPTPGTPNTTPDATQTKPATPPADAAQQQPATPGNTPGQNSAPEQTPTAGTLAPAKEEADVVLPGGMTEEELKQMLVGKPLYLRGGYLDTSLTFGEHGQLIGHSAQGSYTLCGVEIDKVRLTKHKVELEGARYGLHFLGALPYEDPTKAVDRVKITPKKKVLRITIDRELVVTPKKNKEKDKAGKKPAAPVQKAGAAAAAPAQAAPAQAAPVAANGTAAQPQPATVAASGPVGGGAGAQAGAPAQAEASDVEQAKAEMAKAPAAERPADPGSVTTTLSAEHATKVLKEALGNIFAQGFDDRMMAAMPDFWKLYYEAAAAKTDYRPKDATVLRQNTVDKRAKLLTNFEPESNEYAQTNGVAGMALYHTVVGADGKAAEIAVGRPIGFGLDENAVAAIRKASFEPAVKGGKPVPVLLDLVVQFRIYSKRTAVESKPEAAGKTDAAKPAAPSLPGPYSAQHP